MTRTGGKRRSRTKWALAVLAAASLWALVWAPRLSRFESYNLEQASESVPDLPGASTEDSDSQQLSFLTWNLHAVPWSRSAEQRLLNASDEILELSPDVVFLQEVWRERQIRLLRSRLSKRYTFAEPSSELHGWFTRASGLVTLIRKPWRPTDVSFERFQYEGWDWNLTELDAFGDKGFLQVEVEMRGTSFILLNTHLQSEYGEKKYEGVRRRQLRQLNERASAFSTEAIVVLGGDLNVLPEEALFQEVTSHWVDLTEALRLDCECGTRFLADGSESGWVDYLLARPLAAKNFRVHRAWRILNEEPDVPYSDHHGLFVELVLEQVDRSH